MKLLIDDLRQPKDASWTIARNPAEAIRFLDIYWDQVDEIQLDHDNTHFISLEGTGVSHPFPCVCTFEICARYIARLKQINKDWNPKITLRTLNPVGARSMEVILGESGLKTVTEIAA